MLCNFPFLYRTPSALVKRPLVGSIGPIVLMFPGHICQTKPCQLPLGPAQLLSNLGVEGQKDRWIDRLNRCEKMKHIIEMIVGREWSFFTAFNSFISLRLRGIIGHIDDVSAQFAAVKGHSWVQLRPNREMIWTQTSNFMHLTEAVASAFFVFFSPPRATYKKK